MGKGKHVDYRPNNITFQLPTQILPFTRPQKHIEHD